MSFGLSSSIDLAEILFTLFWVFFIGLVFYLRREDKREGYPLDSDRSGRVAVQGFPGVPAAKTFSLTHGGTATAPREAPAAAELAARPAAPYPGAPLVPTGNPMLDGVGPAAYAQRANVPDMTIDGEPRIVPMRVAPGFHVHARDADPRGMTVIGADGEVAGTVRDVWVDRVEPQIRYFEVEPPLPAAVDGVPPGAPAAPVLLPIGFAKVRKDRIDCAAIHAHQFTDVPKTASADQITALEEDRVCAYFAGGTLYADAERQEPYL